MVIPKMLRPYFLHHRELLGGLARAAWETARELMVAAVGGERLRPGMVAVVQTAGDLGNWHPHVHALVSRGGWNGDWQWVHIPEPRRHLVRYYGAYSNVARGKRKQLEAKQAHESVDIAPRPAAEEQDRSPDARSLRRRWRELIKRVYEVDPLVCPRCHAEMRVIAFIIDHTVVDKILRHPERKAEAARERGPPGEVHLEAAS